jgi:glycosyltransferase involved in cell wall biosynthesis
MSNPIISVIIPSYNHAPFVADAVNSVLRQSFKEIEVVIVDDCSTDDSQQVIRSIDDARVRYQLLDVNRGGSTAINIGMEMSKAALIAICNSDDLWIENKLESQMSVLAGSPEVGAVFSNVWWIDERGQQLGRSQVPFIDVFAQPNRSRANWLRTLVERGNCFCHPSVLIKREVYFDRGLYELRYRQLPDYDMWLRLLEKFNVFVMPEKTVQFRLLDNNRNTAAMSPSNSARSINETNLILTSFFQRVDAANFASAFGTLKPIGDPEFCLPLEKILYLISSNGWNEVMLKDIGQKMLFSFLQDQNALPILHTYRLPLDLLQLLMGLSSPWIDRKAIGPWNDREWQFLASVPQHTLGNSFAQKDWTDPDSAQASSFGNGETQECALSKEFSDLLSSNSWRVTQSFRICKAKLLERTPFRKRKGVTSLVQIDDPVILTETDRIQNEIDAIKNSLSWRLSNPIRALKTSISSAFQRTSSLPGSSLYAEDSTVATSSTTTSPARDTEIDLAIFDDFYPCELSAFRHEEFCSLIENIDRTLVFTSGASLPAVGIQPEEIYSVVHHFQSANPEFAGKVRIFNESLSIEPKLAYCLFLSLADRFLPFFESRKIPFVFTIYPGGELRLGDKECEDRIRRVCTSKLFRGLISTQRLVSDYLIDRKLCNKEMITEVIGSVAPRQFEQTNWSEKMLFGKQKDTIDIGFVAHKYTEYGQDKGYDLFAQFALLQAPKFPFLRFHVVGGFDENVIDVSAIRDRITFHGKLNSAAMQHLFKSMDMIMSPNDGVVRGGEIDGFPTGCCTQAGMSGVAVFCTDLMEQNVLLVPNRDFVLIDRNIESICNTIEPFLRNPDKLYRIARQGQIRFRECFGWKSQLNPRLALIRKVLSS